MRPTYALPLLLVGCDLVADLGDDDEDSGADSGVGGGAGGVGDAWRKVSSELTVISAEGLPSVARVDVPTRIDVGDGAGPIQVLVRIEDDTVVTYTWREQDQVHYRLAAPTLSSEDGTWVVWGGGGSQVFTLDDGTLREDASAQLGGDMVLASAAYRPIAGAFPPADWPPDVIDVVLPVEE